MVKITAGSEVIDKLLGGYETDIITTVYGPAGAGKTLLCILCSAEVARAGKKVLYIDTEGGFSTIRVKQIYPDYKKILANMVFLKPVSFKGQKKAFEKLKELVNSDIGLIIVDTISMLYRLELGTSEEVYEVNRDLGKQIAYLSEISRKKDIPVLITNQVYANFDEKGKVNMVGGDILKYGSKCILELQVFRNSLRRAILKKHRSIAEEKFIEFKIVEKGISTVNKEKSLLF